MRAACAGAPGASATRMREPRYRPDVGCSPGGTIFNYTTPAAECMDGVRNPVNAIRGASIRETGGSRKAGTSHPARDLHGNATRLVACSAVPGRLHFTGTPQS